MHRRMSIILLLFAMLCMSFTGGGVNAESELTTKLKENMIPLETTEAGNGFEDMVELKELFKDKKVIAMGEATHGTAEFFQMKHRMFEFLVEEMGYRVFAIEAEFGSSQIVNDYILKGKGSLHTSLDSMKFWTWNTKEVADMIEWMKNYNNNAREENKVRFYGFDMQAIDNSVYHVLKYLGRVDANYALSQKSLLTEDSGKFYHPKNGELKNFNDNIDNLHMEFQNNRDNYIQKSSLEEYELVLREIEVIYQWLDYMGNGTEFDTRDYYMAENVKWILDYENKHYGNDQIMLWAHNGHIGKQYYEYNNMGKLLKSFYKDDYYALGFDFYQGRFAAMPYTFVSRFLGSRLSIFKLDSSLEKSFADEVNKTGIPISFLDFETNKNDKVLSDFLSTRIPMNSIGATYSGKLHYLSFMPEIILKDSYDGMIFISSTTEALRSRPGSTLPDGHRTIVYHNTFMIIVITAIAVLVFISSKKKSKYKSDRDGKFYILGKDSIEKGKNNIVKKTIIKANDYCNSISIFKYLTIVVLLTTALTTMNYLMNSFSILKNYFRGVGIFALINLATFMIIGIVETLVVYVLPLKIVKAVSKKKEIHLNHIIFVSLIMAILNFSSYSGSGILIDLVKFLLFLLYGVIWTYSYGLLYYRANRPIMIISIIAGLQTLIIGLIYLVF